MTDNTNNDEIVSQGKKNDSVDTFDTEALFRYFSSEKGHEVVTRILTIVDDIKKSALEKSTSHTRLETWFKIMAILVVVIATTFLTYFEKFDATVGVLFGTLVGYLFGRK